MSTFASRLKKAMADAEVNSTELARMTGIDKSTISRYLSGGYVPKQKRTDLISQALSVDPGYLITGVDSSEPEIKNLHAFLYTIIPASISAGQLQEVDSLKELPKINVPDVLMGRYAKDKDIVFMHVNGESMNRIISDGSLIAVKTNLDRSSYKNGDIVIASNGRDYTVKYFYDDPLHGQFILNPDSSDKSFTPIICRYDEDDYTLIGKVVIYSVIL